MPRSPAVVSMILAAVAFDAMAAGPATRPVGQESVTADPPTDAGVDPGVAAARELLDVVAAARKARDGQLHAADEAFRTAQAMATAAFQSASAKALADYRDKHKRWVDLAVATYDVRIKDVTRGGDLDRALAVRQEREKLIRDAAAEEAKTIREFEKLAGRPATRTAATSRPAGAGGTPSTGPAATDRTPATSPAASVEALTVSLRQKVDRRFAATMAFSPGRADGDVTWAANPTGLALDGLIQIGNSDKSRGGAWAKGTVVAEAGFALTGGTIRVSGGSLRLRGTPQKPIVLKGVRLECDYTGTVVAENVVFVDCTMQKTGGFYWNDGYSAKWELTDCLLVASNFAKLTRMDYGLKIAGCTFVGCKLPPRTWGYLKKEVPEDDGAKLARGTWSKVSDCDFYDCELAASAVWLTQGCNFARCKVKEPGKFSSRTSLDVELGLEPDDTLLADLTAATTSSGEGQVKYARHASPPDVASENALWHVGDGAAPTTAKSPLPPPAATQPAPADAKGKKGIFDFGQ